MRKGRAADRRALVCGVVGLSGAGIGDTPALVGCCGCCGRGGLLVVGAPACLCAYWGWHAVGFTFNTCWAISPQLVMPDGLSGASGCVVCCL